MDLSEKALLVVDMQKGFCEKGNTLYFPQCEKIKKFVVKKIKEFIEAEHPVIFTLDTHKKDDKEFEKFPPHCIEGTKEVELIDEIKDIIKNKKNIYFIKKSRYSAFFKTNFEDLIKKLKIKEFHIVGVCTDICVLHTAEEIANRDISFYVYKSGTASFDDNAHKFALEHIEKILGGKVI